MTYVYSDVPKQKKDNAPGTKKRVWVAPRSSFDALQVPAAVGAGDGDTILIGTDHTFLATFGFIQLYTTLDTSELVGESVGERDSKNQSVKLECFHPGIYPVALEFARWAQNDDFIILVEMLDGTVVQIGADGLECDISHAINSGKVSGGGKGITFTIEAFGTPYIYTGVITPKP